jgi:ubiquinone/menaquinone biosynthesis C-methylase UbiE
VNAVISGATPKTVVDTETARVRGIMDRLAPTYDRAMDVNEKVLFGGGRAWVCSQAHGNVLEIACGTGRNFPYYPQDTYVTGIELSAAMLDLARARAAALGIDADLRQGDAQALPFADDSFDAVVCTISLCTIPDDRQAVREAWRVLRPGGLLLLLEHVRSPFLPVRLVQRVLDPVWVRKEGDHLLREPLEQVRAVGFEVIALERKKLGIVERVAARKPA